jgi:phage protein D
VDTVVTVLQSETDMRFLRRLAARNGFECYVKGSKGFFRSSNLQDPPQKTLAIEFGEETNLARLNIRMDGTPVTSVELQRVDPMEKQVDNEQLTDTPLRKLGLQTLASLASAVPASRALVKEQIAASTEEMKARLNGAHRGADQFVAIDGEIDSRSYESVLRAKKLVTVKGAGERFSGLYYVTRVKHHFTTEGYVQRFEGWRNGTGLTGDEEFGASLLPVAVPAGLGGASVPGGNRVLPAQQSGTTLPG